MNRKERKARGIKGKKGDRAVIVEALNLARELQKRKKQEEAVALYKQILEFDPDNEIALLDVGIDAYVRKEQQRAERIFEKLLRKNNKNLGANIMLAAIRMDQNRVPESLDLLTKVGKREIPSSLLARIGSIYRDAGRLDQANHFIEKALQKNPQDIPALYTLQSLRKYTPEELDRLDEMNRGKLEVDDKTRIAFTLGKASLDNKQTDKAFWHFAEGNVLKRSTFKFDIGWIEQYFEDIPKLFTKEFRDEWRGTIKDKGGEQIFILGMPRSGTTLVDQILSSHPEVTSVGESSFFTRSIPVMLDSKLSSYSKVPGAAITKALVDDCSPKLLETIGDNYLAKVNPFKKEQRIVVDKMLFNFIWLGFIRLTLPDAKIIHCIRDPIDIGLSIWQLLFTDDMPWAYDQNDIGRYYLAYHKLMDYWRELFPGEFFDNHYEDMVADQEAQSRKVIEFCGLSWHDDCLRFYENKRQVKTASVTQVRKPIYTDSVKKWKKFEPYLTKLIDTVEGRPVAPEKVSQGDEASHG